MGLFCTSRDGTDHFSRHAGCHGCSIKSLEGFRIAWVEEAQTLTRVHAQHRHARQPHQIARSNICPVPWQSLISPPPTWRIGQLLEAEKCSEAILATRSGPASTGNRI